MWRQIHQHWSLQPKGRRVYLEGWNGVQWTPRTWGRGGTRKTQGYGAAFKIIFRLDSTHPSIYQQWASSPPQPTLQAHPTPLHQLWASPPPPRIPPWQSSKWAPPSSSVICHGCNQWLDLHDAFNTEEAFLLASMKDFVNVWASGCQCWNYVFNNCDFI